MKRDVSPEATAAVLADIRDAVRPVEMARTAAAVERVLRTASPGMYEPSWGREAVWPLLRELTPPWVEYRCAEGCGCDDDDPDGLPGLDWDWFPGDEQRERYAPWVVSPHLFEGVAR